MQQDALENKQRQGILRELQSKAGRGGMTLSGEYLKGQSLIWNLSFGLQSKSYRENLSIEVKLKTLIVYEKPMTPCY